MTKTIVIFTGFFKLRVNPSNRRNLSIDRDKINSVKKNLFGTTCSEELEQSLNDQISKQQEKVSQKWEFDFRTGKPTTSSTCYKWKLIEARKLSSNQIDTEYPGNELNERIFIETVEDDNSVDGKFSGSFRNIF